MIAYIRDLLREAVKDVRKYPQIQLALLLVLVMPVAFLYAAHVFLQAGTSNQDYLQQQALHTVHQSMHAVLHSKPNDTRLIQSTVQRLVTENTELVSLRVLVQQGGLYVVLASDRADEVHASVPIRDGYQQAVSSVDQTIHELRSLEDATFWWSLRASRDLPGTTFITETWYDRSYSDQLFLASALQAYIALLVVFILIILIAYWHVRTHSYYELYEETQNILTSRKRFTQMVTHELRAPLTAIRGYASMLLEDDKLSEKQQKQITYIRRSSERVLSIVSELLEIAQIQAGKIAVKIETIDLAELVTETLNELRPLTREKKVSLSQSGVLHSAKVQSDAGRLRQILINLVSNAIKYSEKGRIEIEIRYLKNGYELRVKDTGLGISAENQRKLFAPFFRVQDQKAYDALGVGLGMWITRQYIDVIGATVDVESIKEVGTHVIITIPKTFTKSAENGEEV